MSTRSTTAGSSRGAAPRRSGRPVARAVAALARVGLGMVAAGSVMAGFLTTAAASPEHHAQHEIAAQYEQAAPATLPLSELLSLARRGDVRTARLDTGSDTVTGTLRTRGRLRAYTSAYPAGYGTRLTEQLLADRVTLSAVAATSSGSSDVSLAMLGTAALLAVAWLTLAARRRRTGASQRPGRFGSSQSAASPAGFAKGHGEQVEVPPTRFSDVAGLDEAVESLAELVDYLKDPEKYQSAGADLPRGFLLVGPPGTGKTLLARAVAGEAGVPFFAIGASEFVESYVGVGAARVRALFDRAREAGSAIVFIDELDAIGRARSSHSVPGNEERESTLNQLLVEMDGFATSTSVIVLAATNRPDILDHALLRPGRFDRQIAVPNPDRRGRTHILDLYLHRRHVAPDVDPDVLSRRTAGFSGADLANLVNTAALLAVRAGRDSISSSELEEALATVALGPARKSAVVAAADRRITAWHEAGHALVGLWLEHAADPISVSIVPRGQAGGVTWFPGQDDMFLSRRQATAQLAVAMAGRAAEELLLGDDFTQGAAQDFRAATDLARRMVTEYGMGSMGPGFVLPEETHIGVLAERVHASVQALLEEALACARDLLSSGRDTLERVADRLLEDETLDATTLVAIAGRRAPEHARLPGAA
ncbi:MAG: AAA family ATPase [Actinomycetota bacterium]|nr:AAA family ATPase [Actinomycetota bacterium]